MNFIFKKIDIRKTQMFSKLHMNSSMKGKVMYKTTMKFGAVETWD